MDKRRAPGPDPVQARIAQLRALFPGCVTETLDAAGAPRLAVDFDRLRQELGGDAVEGPQERYRLDWPGKRAATALADAPVEARLRPVRAESVDFDATRNLIVEGDNLDALKLLRRGFLGKVKLIYIDPPYNTGKDFIYDDDFREEYSAYLDRAGPGGVASGAEAEGRFHAAWLSMINARLRAARDLLTEDGVVAIHIDENEYANLEKILAELFGERNNLGTVVWDKRNPKGDASRVAQQHEYIALYARDYDRFKAGVDFRRPKANAQAMLDKAAALVRRNGGVDDAARAAYRTWLSAQDFSAGEKAYRLMDDDGDVYRAVSMAWPNKRKAPDAYFIPLIHPKTGRPCPVPMRGWRNPPGTMQALRDAGRILFGPDETIQPTRKYLLKENMKENISSLLYFGGSDDALLSRMGLVFDNPKPVPVLRRIIGSIASGDDVVLDFFAGSGACAHAVMALNAAEGANLRFILVQQAEAIADEAVAAAAGCRTIADLCRERVRRAGRMIAAEEGHPGWRRDTGFRALRLEGPEERRRGADDLLFGALEALELDPTTPLRRETVQGKPVFVVGGGALVACLGRGLSEALAVELAGAAPRRVLFRRDGAGSAAMRVELGRIFHRLAPGAEVIWI